VLTRGVSGSHTNKADECFAGLSEHEIYLMDFVLGAVIPCLPLLL